MPGDRAKRRGRAPKPRVLWVSDSPRLHTGHGRAADEITKRLAASGRYELSVLGWSVDAPADDASGYTAFPPGPQAWSSARINRVIEDIGPDVVVTSGPLSILGVMNKVPLREFVSWIGYAFFEGAPLPARQHGVVRQMDRVVVASSWCRSALAKGPRREALPTSRVEVIPLGVDPGVFYPRPDRKAVRAASGLEGRFVIGCVAKNEFRKQIPVLLEAFATFASRHADAFLYLHMDPDGPAWPLPELVKRHQIERRVAFTRGLAGPMGVGSRSLNTIYNLFDVMVLPTMGEAFGLPIVEAMAAGVPVVATDCSAVSELVEGRGELIPVRAWLTMSWDNAEYALADGAGLVSILERLHTDRELREGYAARGRVFAEQQTWDRTGEAWVDLLSRVISGRPGRRRALRPWLEAVRAASLPAASPRRRVGVEGGPVASPTESQSDASEEGRRSLTAGEGRREAT